MDDWKQLFQFSQSVFIGIVFSFLIAKLISVVVSFREENLSIVRDDSALNEPKPSSSELKPIGDDTSASVAEENSRVSVEEQSVIEKANEAIGNSLAGDDDGGVDSDDDWEGVESTELDEAFSAASAFVAAAAADRLSQKVSNDVQLQLYGLYKISTEGPCSTPQPSAIKMTARAKWQAWQKLGAMPPEEAMQKYIAIVTELYPSWTAGSTSCGDSSDAPSGDTKGPMGPVFSTFVYEEESGNELKMDAIHAFAREGDEGNLLKCIHSGVSVNLKDSEGRTALHWAVDRGHLNIIELLVSKNTDVNAKDNEGQSPLHYAAVCEREAIAKYLVKKNAATDLKDEDGNTPYDLCDIKWPWLQCAVP
ncbi:Acyl-CoA-binding domain-containing protein [Actinidia chinensis var. chinensis]|uniref:Acyl-CoA-binding domain-containing protein n=1 Tax=Actinidia chinensis var. chinensis TaxID=1590841 RepID=A0A2R6RQL3_ACTCC|nr:Acyl-CoA-binding domain-containing protein [Actinidia chinensis var. chinensis]